MRLADFVRKISKDKPIDIRPFVAEQVRFYISQDPMTKSTHRSPAEYVLKKVIADTGHVEKKTYRSEAGKKLSNTEKDSDSYTNIVNAWARSDKSRRGNPDLAKATFYWFFRYIPDQSYFTEIARRTWPNASDDFKRFIYAKCGGEPNDDFAKIIARFNADIDEVRREFRKLWTPETSRAPMEPPPYVTEQDIKDAIEKDAESGIWLNPHNHHSIPLSGRKKEKRQLTEFMVDPRPFLICPLIAPSGAGKTRLVSEWMKPYVWTVSPTEWDAGLVTSSDPEARIADCWKSPDDGGRWQITRDTLIVIDYTFAFDEVVRQITERARKQDQHKIRLLVVDHVYPQILKSDYFWSSVYGSQQILDIRQSKELLDPIELGGESHDSTILRDVIAAVASNPRRKYRASDRKIKKAAETLFQMGVNKGATSSNREAVRHPLFAALMGHAIRHDRDFSHWTRRHLIDYYFYNDWRIPWKTWNDMRGFFVGALVSAATFRRGISTRRADSYLPGDGQEIIQYANRIVSSYDRATIKPFEPDILGEAFLLFFLQYASKTSGALNLPEKFNMRAVFIDILTSYNSENEADQITLNFLEVMARLVRNLAADDQTLDGQPVQTVRDGWEALFKFLQPTLFAEKPLFRMAISMSIVDLVRQLDLLMVSNRPFLHTDLFAYFAELRTDMLARIDVADLEAASATKWSWPATAAFFQFYELLDDDTRQVLNDNLMAVSKNFTVSSEDGTTALHLAAREGCVSVAKFVRNHFTEDLNAKNHAGLTALMVASQAGHADVVDRLVAVKADVNLGTTDKGATALILASLFGHADVVDLLLTAKAKVNLGMTDIGATALILASDAGHADVVDRLLTAKADVNLGAKDDGATALILASLSGHADVVDLLLTAKAEVNLGMTDFGDTALMAASGVGHTDVVDLLLTAMADVNLGTTDRGTTALMVASGAGHADVVERLLTAKAGVNLGRTDNGATALMMASGAGHTEVVDRLLTAKAEVNLRTTDNGATALMLASHAGHADVVDRLLTAKAEVNLGTTDNGATALILASDAGHTDVVDRLLAEKAEVNLGTTDNGTTALMAASDAGHADVVDHLLTANADVNLRTVDYGITALMAASLAGHVDVVERLLTAKADVNLCRTDNGASTLMAASGSGHANVVERLLIAKADVNLRRTDNGASTLMAASHAGHADVVDHLLTANADVNLRTADNGTTALMAASLAGHVDVVERLLTAEAGVNLGRTDNGATALISASYAGHGDVVERLLTAKADVNLGKTDNGATALMAASLAGHVDVVERLLTAKADVNLGTTDDGATALILASHAGHANIVDRLLTAKADVNQGKTDDGATALILASHAGHANIVDRLLTAKADVNQGKMDNGATALMAASHAGHANIVDRLLTARADVNLVTTDNCTTALMVASQAGQTSVVKRLLMSKELISEVRSKHGLAAADYAQQTGCLEIVELIQRASTKSI